MEMTQTNSNTWGNKTTVLKGNIGERIVREYLEQKGYIVYEPKTGGAHGFDKLAILNKKQAIIVECKSKARRNKYPDTGIDIRHLNDYEYISKKHNLPIFIFFIDELMGEIYGNKLSELMVPCIVCNKSYPSREKNIIYFPLVNMKKVGKIGVDEIKTLKLLSTRNYDYLQE